jgi:hypothetical protein
MGKAICMGYERLVLVEWADSCGATARWQYLDESGPEYVLCRSVGWLAYDGEDCKRVVPHLGRHKDDERQQGCGDMTIPTSAILRIADLRTVMPSRKRV